jgi:hypothetical protein
MTPEEKGKENQAYYLRRQREEIKKGKRPWHHYTRAPHCYQEIVTVTPEMAQELLDCAGAGCRLPNQKMVDAYAQDILEGRFLPSVIATDPQGGLADGLMRLHGLRAAGKEVPVTMLFNAQADPMTGQPIIPPKKKTEYRSIDAPWEEEEGR